MIRRLLQLIAGFRRKAPAPPVDANPGPAAERPRRDPFMPMRGGFIPDRPSVPASARASLASHLSRGQAASPEISFQRVRIGAADSFVCGLCSAVIVKASSPGVAYQLADHRRWHAQRGDLR